MFDQELENSLISQDIVSLLGDYCSLQSDIDEKKIKSAAIIAQRIDIRRIIGEANLQRCIEDPVGTPVTGADLELKKLVIPAWCYFTYSRLLKSFQGTYTDSGLIFEPEATDKDQAKTIANEMASIADDYMTEVLEFLEAEDPNDENVKAERLSPRIRSFGGKENRGSN